MKKLGFDGDLLLQKHIRLGKINTNFVVLVNTILALVTLIVTSIFISELTTNSYGWLWFIWGFIGAALSDNYKLKGKKDLLVSLPAQICTYIAAYVICGIYWLFAKMFIKE